MENEVLKRMIGQVFTKITGLEEGSEEVKMVAESGDVFTFWHESDCCESVSVNQIDGDFQDLLGFTLLMAEESTSDKNPLQVNEESFTWTFYKFATVKGYVTVRWYGSSNGYYSETVSIGCRTTDGKVIGDCSSGWADRRFPNPRMGD